MDGFTEGAYKTFEANVPADLIGKEGYLVERLSTGKIQLLTTGLAIGVLYLRLEGGSDWTVRLLGKGGTVKMVAGGVIAANARVKGASGGKVVTNANVGRAVGIKLSTGNSADGDVIEVLDIIEPIVTPTAAPAALTHAVGTADGTVADVGGAFNQGTLNDNFKELSTQVNSLRTALITAGVLT